MAKISSTKNETSRKRIPVKQKSDFQPQQSSIAATSPDQEEGLNKLFLDSIKDIYWAENHLVKSLPKMINATNSQELQGALNDHLQVTEEHVARLENIFELLGKKPQAKKCDAMEGLSKEGEGILESTDSGTAARDQGIIMAAQKVEHYEIASYTGLAKLAKTLGLTEVSALLERTLTEEQEADQLLGTIADNATAGYTKAVPAQKA